MKFGCLSLVFISLFTVSAFAGSSSSPEKDEKSWGSDMQELKHLVEELIPAIFSLSEFERVKNTKEFKDDLEKFSKISHSVKVKAEKSKELPSADPSLRFVSTILEDNAKQAYEAYQIGQKEWARGLVKQSLGHCFACHSTDRFGPQFETEEDPKFLKGLSTLDKADFYIATRNFEEALKLYKESIESVKLAKNLPGEWQRAVRNGLALAVRIKNDPKLAEGFINTAMKKEFSSNPIYDRDLKAWKAGVLAWKTEQKRSIDPAGEKAHFDQVQGLAKNANHRKQFDADRSGEIEYLRLSAAAHEFFKRYPESKYSADILFHLGTAYDSLRGLGGLWMLQDAYWEACIYARPNSKVSWKCYKAYRDSVHKGYSGSRGLDLPIGLAFKLQQLERFAK